MGVRGLRTFLSKHCPDTTRRRDIIMMTSTYRRKTVKVPTIVVDAPACVFALFQKADMHFAGQFEEFKKFIERFVDAFRKEGIKLVFFFDGWRPDEDLEEYWRSQRAMEVRYMQKAMHEIKTGEREKLARFEQAPSEILNWVRIFFRLTLKSLYKDDPLVEVYNALENTRTLVIADYAIHNDCVGILSDDTIYLYYTDTVPVMSCRKLDIINMTTLISNRYEICRHFKIKQDHLKIMAAITNTESYVDADEFYPFFEFISDGRYVPRTPNPYPHPFDHIINYLNGLGNRSYEEMVDIFTKDLKMYGTEELASFFRDYLMDYELDRRNPNYYRPNCEDEYAEDFKNDDVINFFTKKMTTCDLFTMPLEVMTNRRVVIFTTPLQDEEDNTLIGHIMLFRPIRQRLYGFIFNSPEIKQKTIIESWASFDEDHQEESVEPILEPFNDLSLTKLWSHLAEMDVRMECLLKCFGFTLNDGGDSFLNIPIKYQPLAVVLRYLFQHPEMNISEWEVGAFIIQAINSSVHNKITFKELELESLDSRGAHLAGLFVDGIILYLNVALCCRFDLQLFMPWNYFHGKRFQSFYQKMKSGSTANALLSENDVEAMYRQLFVFITS